MTKGGGMRSERIDTLIVGGGQAGLAAGYALKKQGRDFTILESNDRIGDSWRTRWDSLKLFTPAKFCKLPGVRFPGRSRHFPTKDEMGDYLEDYASRFDMDTRTGVRVEKLSRNGRTYVLETSDGVMEADNVVIASGAHQTPKVPAFAQDLDRRIVQLHSVEYKNPSQLRKGGVLIVGLGNSGAEIANEVSRTHTTYVSGKPSAQIPIKHQERGALIFFRLIRFIGHRVLTLRTPIGRKVQPKFIKQAAPLIRVKTKDLERAGVERVARVAGVENGRPVLEDGRVLDVANVIWCTGFREAYPWIDLPIFDETGRPRQYRGVVEESPGLYFMGVVFQYAASSDVLPGVGRDGEYIAKKLASRKPSRHHIGAKVVSGRSR